MTLEVAAQRVLESISYSTDDTGDYIKIESRQMLRESLQHLREALVAPPEPLSWNSESVRKLIEAHTVYIENIGNVRPQNLPLTLFDNIAAALNSMHTTSELPKYSVISETAEEIRILIHSEIPISLLALKRLVFTKEWANTKLAAILRHMAAK